MHLPEFEPPAYVTDTEEAMDDDLQALTQGLEAAAFLLALHTGTLASSGWAVDEPFDEKAALEDVRAELAAADLALDELHKIHGFLFDDPRDLDDAASY